MLSVVFTVHMHGLYSVTKLLCTDHVHLDTLQHTLQISLTCSTRLGMQNWAKSAVY